MCGIAGILKFNPRAPVEEGRLTRMRDVLWHRGPDEAGSIIAGNAGLAHRRLSIIDLANGQQPMPNADRSVWITYNGELYNARELRDELRSRGHTFRTQCDTEVVLRAYEAFGRGCVEKLRGMFAFGIWDQRRRRLFLARDRLGIKPLYYAAGDEELLFGSEIKSILEAQDSRPEFNQAVLPEYLASRYAAGGGTFYRGIQKLLPGCTLTWSPEKGFREQRYWKPPIAADGPRASLKECAEEVRAKLEESVRSHLVSDVPLGLFLSGGIDSTVLASMVSSMKDEPIETFAVGFEDRAENELDYARLAAGAVGANHHETVVSPEQYFEALPKLIWHEDEPIAFPASVPLYFISSLAAEHVKVVMTGEGADELFLGYNRYRVTAWNQRLGRAWEAAVPGFVRDGVRGLVERLPHSLRRYPERTFLKLPPEARHLFYENFAIFSEARQRSLLSDPQLLNVRDPYGEALRYFDDGDAGVLERMSNADMQTYLVELLMKQDQMSMAASIESRVPFLDHELVEQVASIPGRYKIRGFTTKAVLREAIREVIPKEILNRPKMGFPVPLARWFKGPFSHLVDEFVTGPRAMRRGHFDPAALERLAGEHREGRANHGDRLWLLINLEIWQRIAIDGEPPEAVMPRGGEATVSRRAA